MNIAITAHDAKKELMVQFCIAYCGILSRYTLCGTGTTSKMVSEATGLEIQRFLSGAQGGDQQIAARIACNEIDLLLFFRDPLNPKSHETANDMNLLRLCDMHNIPVATNIATAEMLIHGLRRPVKAIFPVAKPAGTSYNIPCGDRSGMSTSGGPAESGGALGALEAPLGDEGRKDARQPKHDRKKEGGFPPLNQGGTTERPSSLARPLFAASWGRSFVFAAGKEGFPWTSNNSA